MRNLEVKAKVTNLEATLVTATRLSGSCFSDVQQIDTYFFVPEGRLKLREYESTAELIFYNRPDSKQPRSSDYLIAEIEQPTAVKEILTRALKVRTVVDKRRRVFLVGNTRIHVDEVESLGAFLEFEVVLEDSTGQEDPKVTVEWLISEFGIKETDMVDGSYNDLLEQRPQ